MLLTPLSYISYKLHMPDYYKDDEHSKFEYMEAPDGGQEFENDEGQEDEQSYFNELSRFESMTQNAVKKVEFDEQTGELQNSYYYGFLTDWQLLVNDEDLRKQKGPTLLMEICYTDSWGRYSLEGYAFCEIPTKPGSYEFNVPSWKPKSTTQVEVMNYFLGGTLRVRKLEDIASPSFKVGDNIQASMNRLTTKTVSSGFIKLRFNIAHQSG